MTRCPDWDVGAMHDGGPGAFCWVFPDILAIDEVKATGRFKRSGRSLYVFLPGKAGVTRWPIRPLTTGKGHSWGWDGNEDAPTLDPSLHLKEVDEEAGTETTIWHGHVRAGMLLG